MVLQNKTILWKNRQFMSFYNHTYMALCVNVSFVTHTRHTHTHTHKHTIIMCDWHTHSHKNRLWWSVESYHKQTLNKIYCHSARALRGIALKIFLFGSFFFMVAYSISILCSQNLDFYIFLDYSSWIESINAIAGWKQHSTSIC